MVIAGFVPVSTSVISKITSNEWKSDTLIVHGTLTNTSSSSVSLMTPALIGYDGKNQEVDAGRIVLANPELKGGQTEAFTAEISDPRKSIKFTKLVGIRSRYYVATRPAYVVAATPEVTTTPYATASPALALFRNPYSRANFRPFFAICVFGQRFWRILTFVILGIIGVCGAKFLLKLASSTLAPRRMAAAFPLVRRASGGYHTDRTHNGRGATHEPSACVGIREEEAQRGRHPPQTCR